MKYDLDIAERVFDKFTDDWQLPDQVLDKLEQRFDSELAANPVAHLRKADKRGKITEYHCRVTNQVARCLVYDFIFRIHYGQDEHTLLIYDAFLKPLDLAEPD